MKSQLVMRTLLATALVMAVVACGKTKGGGAVRGRNAKIQTTGQQGGQKTTDADKDIQVAEDDKQVVTDKTTAEGVEDDADADTNEEADSSGNSAENATTENKPATPAAKQNEESVPLSNDQLKRMLLESTRYTGAGKDSLRQMLQAKMEANDNQTSKTLNLKTANSIVNAALIIDREFKEVAVKIAQNIDGKKRTTELTGALDGNLVGNLNKSRGSVDAEGTVQCLDKSARSCNVAHARILLGETGSRAVINIIFRSSGMNVLADVKYSAEKQSLTKEQEAFKKLFTANQLKLQNTDRINNARLQMDSFEVIQGASAARINILTTNNEIITMKAPLLDFDVVGERVFAFADISTKNMDLVDLETAQTLKTNYQAMIQEARLVKNSKDGSLEFSLAVGPKDNSDSAQVVLKVQRVQTAIKTGNTLSN